MKQSSRLRWLGLCLVITPWLAAGCADGPLASPLASMNPWVRRKWEADEQYGPTYHRRISELRDLRESMEDLEPARAQQLAAEMAQLIKSDPNPMLRVEAVAILGQLGGPTALTALTAAVNDADKDVRIAACRAWSQIHSEDAMAILGRVVEQDSDVDVRLSALNDLATFKDPSAVQSLGKALDDYDPAVQYRAVQALKNSTGLDYGDSVPAWRDYVQGREPTTPSSPSLVQRLYDWF